MNGIEIIVIFLAAVCVAAVVAHRRGIPSPILFILAGIGLGFVPGIAAFEIPPEYMLLIFLPLLLMEAAYFTSIRDFRYNLRSILQLAIGLVIVTTVTTAWIFQKIVPDGTWLAGLVLGAIISPPDAIAATAIARQVKMPKRVQTILEGESLVNDAVGLVLYRVAVAAALTGSYDVASISMDFIWKLVSGVSIGVVFGRIFILLFPAFANGRWNCWPCCSCLSWLICRRRLCIAPAFWLLWRRGLSSAGIRRRASAAPSACNRTRCGV